MSYMTDWMLIPAIVLLGIVGYYTLNLLFVKPKDDTLDYTGERYLDSVRRRMDRSHESRAPRTWE